MSEPTAGAARCCLDFSCCSRCDLLVGLDGLHVTGVERDDDLAVLIVAVESTPTVMGCRTCGVVAHSHGRRDVVLVDAPCFDRAVQLVWGKRTWRCIEPSCPTGVFTEHGEHLA